MILHIQILLLLLFFLCFSSPMMTADENNTLRPILPTPPSPSSPQPPPSPDPGVKPNNTWTTYGAPRNYSDGSSIWPVCNDSPSQDNRNLKAPSFGCGIYRNSPTNSFLFAVFANPNISKFSPLVVWSANRNRPVKDHASVHFTEDGDLQLADMNRTVVWSTKTSGKSVVSMSVTTMGNLIIYGNDTGGGGLWQSFESPTDVILPGQSLTGKKVFSNVSQTNSSRGDFYIQVTSESFDANVLPYNQTYYKRDDYLTRLVKNGILLPAQTESDGRGGQWWYMSIWRLECDGHLKSYNWTKSNGVWDWKTSELGNISLCSYPTVCGNYSLCTAGGCSCLNTTYFKQKTKNPNEGCEEINPLSCPSSPLKNHTLLQFYNYSFYGFNPGVEYGQSMDLASCKKACSGNCSCKGAFFKYDRNRNISRCYLSSTILSVYENTKKGYNFSAFIKVQVPSSGRPRRTSGNHKTVVIGSTMGVVLFLVACIATAAAVVVIKKRRREKEWRGEEFAFSQIQGGPHRFSYRDLRVATNDFSHKLGEGGFGEVFEGSIPDGTRVAVKMLGQKEQGKKEFVAEVETIGNIHHVNLVRLVGYCAEKLHRLLVYELMSNGSLEKWIFPPTTIVLDWKTRFKIMHDVAKALSYLHEECRHRIIHLDIKPQNILLDSSFNAKVSDFGLSKLVDRDQSQVFTTLRGTPGYLAPEWLSSAITEKVDVYSFGVVLLEVICGMRGLDRRSRSSGSAHLINVVKKAEEEKRLFEIIDRRCCDSGEEEDYTEQRVMKMLRLAIWCLHCDYNKRPSMSVVVKVLEGLMELEPTSTDNFFPPSLVVGGSTSSNSTAPASTVILGPR